MSSLSCAVIWRLQSIYAGSPSTLGAVLLLQRCCAVSLQFGAITRNTRLRSYRAGSISFFQASTISCAQLSPACSTSDLHFQCTGYSLAPDGVRLQMRQERGGGGGMQGTGLAYVTFVSAEEAERARQERDRQVIGTRYIECMPYTPQPPSYGAPGGGGGYGEGGGAGGGRGPHPSGEAMGGGEPAGVPPPPGAPGGSPSGGPLGGPGQGAHMGGGHMVGPPGGGHMGGGHMGGGHMGGPHTGGFGSGERGFGLAPGAHMGPPAIPGRAPPGGGPNREGGVPAGGLGMAQPPPPHRTGGLAPAPPNPPPYDARHPGPSIPGAKGPVKARPCCLQLRCPACARMMCRSTMLHHTRSPASRAANRCGVADSPDKRLRLGPS